MSARAAVRLVLAVLATIALGAVAWPRDGGNPFRGYAGAVLEPRVGLRDLRLGETSLIAFLERFGAGRPTLVFGDDTAVELAFPRAGATVIFVVVGSCAVAVQRDRAGLVRALRSPARFGDVFPACADEPLDSLALALVAGRSFWQGGTVQGVRLGQPRSTALAAMGVAPIDPNRAGPESWFDPSGLVVRFAGEPGDEASWRVAELVAVAP